MTDNQTEIGKVYGRLKIVSVAYCKERKRVFAVCNCICGNTTTVRLYKIKMGVTKSCGCYKKQCIQNVHKTRKKRHDTIWIKHKQERYVLKHLVDYYKLSYATTLRHIKKFGFTFDQSLKIQRAYKKRKV